MKFLFHTTDSRYCSSLLSLRQNLNFNIGFTWDFNENLDVCCHSYHKCNANMPDWKIPRCDCEYTFRECLKNESTSLSGLLAFGHSLNTPECYSTNHSIGNCIKFESFLRPGYPIYELPDITNSSTRVMKRFRCIRYQFNENEPRQYQLLDLPFFYTENLSNNLKSIEKFQQYFTNILKEIFVDRILGVASLLVKNFVFPFIFH